MSDWFNVGPPGEAKSSAFERAWDAMMEQLGKLDLVPIESGDGTVLPEQPGDRERFFSMTTEQLQAEWEQVRQQALGIMRQAVGGILGGRKATTESERRQLREEVEDVLTMRGVAYAASAIKQLVDDLSRPVNIEQESHLSSALDSCPEHEDCQPDVVLG